MEKQINQKKETLIERVRKSYPVRQFNLDDENWLWLRAMKDGRTWNDTFTKIRKLITKEV